MWRRDQPPVTWKEEPADPQRKRNFGGSSFHFPSPGFGGVPDIASPGLHNPGHAGAG